jgi:hypothetical protein
MTYDTLFYFTVILLFLCSCVGVAERTVADVIELFTDNYNKVNPDFAIAKDTVHLTDNR